MSIENIFSWLLYVSVFSAAGILAHIGIQKKDKFITASAILLPAIIGGLRYSVGVDYESYVEKLELLDQRGLVEYLTTGLLNIFEPTFYILAEITFSTPQQAIGFFTITSGLISLFYYLASKKFSPNHTSLMYFLLLMTVFARDLSGVRQGVAVAVSFYAISLLLDKKPVRFLLFVLLAGMFHYSAFIMLAVYPAYWLLYKRWPYIKDQFYVTKITVLAGSGYGASVILLKNLSHVPFFGRYAYLLSPEKLTATGAPNVLTKLAPVLLVAPYYPKLIKQNSKNAFYMFMSIMAIALTALGFFAGPILRLANYFIPFYTILFMNVIDTYKHERRKRFAVYFIILYAIAHFTGSNLIRNSYGIFPYQFIF